MNLYMRNRHLGMVMIAPAIGLLCLVMVYPIVYCIYLSFHSFDLLDPSKIRPFVGFANYRWLFQFERFWGSLANTGILVSISLAIQIVLGLGLALLLNRDLKDKGVLRTLLLLPIFIASVVVALQWRWMLIGQFGVLNYVLATVGIQGPVWLTETWPARWSIIIAESWVSTSFVMIVFLAGLKSMPLEPFEAARIDGASAIKMFRYITLPLLRSAFLVVLLIRIVDAIKMFDIVYVLTGGGPANTTEVMPVLIHNLAFGHFTIARACTLSVILVGISTAASLVLIRLLRRVET